MPVYAELHDGRRLEFPDGTDPAVVQRTVKSLIAAPETSAQPDDPGAAEAALIAAGRGTDRLLKGAQQIWYAATGNQKGLDGLADDVAEEDRLYKPLAEKHPVATTVGQIAPTWAAGMLTGGTSLLSGAAAGALPSLLSYGSAEERAKRGIVDAAAGAGGVLIGRGVARLLKPSGAGTQAVSDTVTDAAQRLGYKPTPAQISQNPAMAAIENYLLRSPGSSARMQSAATANQTALNRAAAKAMGETADTLDEGVFSAAQNRIGSEFSRLNQATSPQIGDDFLSALGHIDAANKARGPFANKNIDGLIDKGLDLAAKGDLSGKAYKEIRTELSNQAQSAFKSGDATSGQAYKSVVAALDEAANKSLPKADQDAWALARQQWSAYKTLTKGNVAEGGNVSAPRVAAALRARGPQLRNGSATGELADIARIGEAFKSVPNPTSGQLMQAMSYVNPVTGVPLALANKAAATAYMSPLGQRYFSRGLLDVGATGQGLLGRAGAATAIPVVRGFLGVE